MTHIFWNFMVSSVLTDKYTYIENYVALWLPSEETGMDISRFIFA